MIKFTEILKEAEDKDYKKMLAAAKKKIKGLESNKMKARKIIEINFPTYKDQLFKDLDLE